MRSTEASAKAITDVLIDAQNGDIPNDPFLISSNMQLKNFQPADYTVDMIAPEDGVFVYFDDTNFNKSNSGGNSFGHLPGIDIAIYVSSPATKTAGVVTSAVENANNTRKLYSGQIFDAIHHTEFLRLMNDKLKADPTISDDVRCSKCTVIGAKNIIVLRLTESSKAIAIYRFMIDVDITEITGFNPGIPFNGTNDQITPYRREEDFEDEQFSKS